jgi:hypothetical protein
MSRKSHSVSQESATISFCIKLYEEAKVHVYVHIGQYALPSGVGGGAVFTHITFLGQNQRRGKRKEEILQEYDKIATLLKTPIFIKQRKPLEIVSDNFDLAP